MPLPDLAALAEGDLPAGQHWILKAGGTSTDFHTGLETIHPDGHRDEGGMGGPPLYPGDVMNTSTGGSDRGLRRVVVRADPRVVRVGVQLARGEQLELPPLATQPDIGLSFFATLPLRPSAWSRSPPSMQTVRCWNLRICPGMRRAGGVSSGGSAAQGGEDSGHPAGPTPPRGGRYGLVMARWLLVKNRRPSGSWPVTVQDDADRSGVKRGADGEVHSWDELQALAAKHAIEPRKVGGPGLAEMRVALGPAPDA